MQDPHWYVSYELVDTVVESTVESVNRMTKTKPEVAISRAQAEAVILELCHVRGLGKTICPSEAARVLTGSDGDWRRLMEIMRAAGRELHVRGEIETTQRGRVVDMATVKGPIRFGLPKV